MDVKLALVAYVLPGLALVFGIPMALGLIPPNRFYGYRTRKTFSSTGFHTCSFSRFQYCLE